ncbi:hypothetical protein SK128_007438 [Halocaridina rubra]|uniref:Uncharacterized protein n=1 Tax=Halocaridina rubra TaxID=373956 RepID=A0AAN8XD60_HALRR
MPFLMPRGGLECGIFTSRLDEDGSVVGGARSVIAQRPICDCYPDGHLRALRATTWHEDPNAPRR